MSANLKLILEGLHEILTVGVTDAFSSVLDLKSNISNLTDHDFVVGVSYIFDAEKGVLPFLDKSAHLKGKEWSKICAELLSLLRELVEKKNLQDKHISLVIDQCVSLFLKIETKANIVIVVHLLNGCIVKLHELGSGYENVIDIADMLYKSFSNKQRSSLTVTDAICSFMQKAMSLAPTLFDDDRVTKWLSLYIHNLRTEMVLKRQKKKSPEMQIIAASFTGINGVLTNFSNLVPADTLGEIFRLLVLCCNPNVEVHRHAMQLSVLSLLAGHTPKFTEHLYKENIKLLDFLVKMLDVKNAGLRSSVCKGLSALVLEMSKEMTRNDEEGAGLFQHYLTVLVPLLQTPHRRQISSVMQCLGHLALPCKHLLGDEKLVQLFEKILSAGEKVYTGGPADNDADYSLLIPSVITALADTVNCIEMISPDMRQQLAAPIISLIEVYPDLHGKVQRICFNSVQHLLGAVYSDRDFFQWLLNEITYQGLLRCSSNSDAAEYSPLWCDLLNKYSNKIQDIDVKREIHASILDTLTNSFLVIFEKLDLRPTKEETNDSENDVTQDIPQNKDVEVFRNLSLLLTDIISNIDDDRLEKWMLPLIDISIRISNTLPELECAYWLLNSILTYCDTSEYFACPSHLAAGGKKLQNFGHSLIDRLDRLTENTRIASISMILSYSVSLIKDSVDVFVLALKEALIRGIGCLEVGVRGVDSMWRIVRTGNRDILSEHYPTLLPLLNPYLCSKSDTVDRSEVSLYGLQRSIVLLCGTLGGAVNSHLITPQLPEISWSSGQVLNISLSLGSSHLNLCLDEMMREVIVLCKTSTDVQTRASACELLHALFLVSVATEQQAPNKVKVLYHHSLPVLLELGCDSNTVVRQIFKELTFQIIHWQTSRAQESFILQHILSGIQQSTNMELRKFCGECIQEFFEWSLKHSSDTMSPAIRNVFKNILYCAEHPTLSKQHAAATAFNAFYRTFREEEVLVSDYTMTLLCSMLDGFALKHSSIVEQAISHLTRIIAAKHEVFSKPSKTRVHPRFGGDGTLLELTKHVFTLSHSPEPHVRDVTRVMYLKLYHLNPGCSNHHLLLDKFGKDVLPVLDGDISTKILSGVISWVYWLTENSIVSDPTKLMDSLDIVSHAKRYLASDPTVSCDSALLLNICLFPKLWQLVTEDNLIHLLLAPASYLSSNISIPLYTELTGRIILKIDKSRDNDLVNGLRKMIHHMSESGELLEAPSHVLMNISLIYKRNLSAVMELSLQKLQTISLSQCLLQKNRYVALTNLYLSSISTSSGVLDSLDRLKAQNPCLISTIKEEISLDLKNLEILDHVLKMEDSVKMLTLTADLLNFSRPSSQLISDMTRMLLSNWSLFDTCSLLSRDHQTLLLDIISTLCRLAPPDILSETGFLRTLYSLLLSKTCTSSQRIKVIAVLKVLKLENHMSSMTPILEEFTRQHLPLLSTELETGSIEAGEYAATVNALCLAATSNHATPIIEIVSKIVCREDCHPSDKSFSSTITHIASTLNSNNYSTTCQLFLKRILNENDGEQVCRKAMVPLLHNVNKLVLIRFVESNWSAFSKHLDVNSGYLVNQCMCEILEVFLVRTIPTDVPTDIGKDIIRISAKVREVSKFAVSDDKLCAWYKRNQALYSLLTHALIYCDKEYKFFDGLVLSEKGNKKVWCNVISEEYPTAMPLEASYGKRILSETENEDATPSSAGSFTLLLESSLSQDVTQYSQNPAIGTQAPDNGPTQSVAPTVAEDAVFRVLRKVFEKFADKQEFLQRVSQIFGDTMIANNVKVHLSQVLLSVPESLNSQLPHISDVLIEWLVSRGVIDNITEEVLSLAFNKDIKIADSLTCTNLLMLMLTQCSVETDVMNDLIGLSAHLLKVWKCAVVDLGVFAPHLLITNTRASTNACRSLKLLFESSCTLKNCDKLFGPLLELLASPKKRMYGPVAVVLGLLLTWMKQYSAEFYSESMNQINDICLALFRDSVQLLKFICIVQNLSKSHAETAARFQGQLMDNLSRTHGKTQSMIIDTMNMVGDDMSVVVGLEKIGMEKLMRDTEVQVTVAKALIRSADTMSSKQILAIITDIVKVIDITTTSCKTLLLEFVTKCQIRSISDEISKRCTAILIRSVCDKDMQLPALQFWNSFLPSNVSDRFTAIVKLYSVGVDDIFLKAITIILISLGQLSASYQSPIFVQPLATDLSWQEQDISGTLNFERKRQGVIRATQKTFQFSQTQSEQKSATKSVVRTPRGFLSRSSGGTQRTLSYSQLATAKMRHQRKQHSQQARHKAIHLVRNYRVGELPDIQLLYKDLLSPLNAIAQISDSFSAFVLQAILHEQLFDSQEEIMLILEKTSSQSLAKFCIELCLKRSYVVSDISSTAIKHHQYSLGILLAEEAISQSHIMNADWTELCNLYGAIGDHDSILGIRKHHMKCDAGILQAVTAMSHKNFTLALKKFNELENPPKEDTLQCMLNLCQWSEIESDVDELPPSILSSKLKLSCMAQSIESFTLADLESVAAKYEDKVQVESYGLLSLLFNVKRSDDKALSNVYNAIDSFLRQWKVAEQDIQRINVLHPCQGLAELYDVVHNQSQLSSQWNSCFPEEIATPMPIWHNLINQRRLLAKSKVCEVESYDSLMEDDDDTRDTNGEYRIIFAAAKSALRQNSVCVAKKLLQRLDVSELRGVDLTDYFVTGTEVTLKSVENNIEDMPAAELISQLQRMLGFLEKDQKVASARLNLTMAKVLYKNPSASHLDAGEVYSQGIQCLSEIDSHSLDAANIGNHEVVLDLLSSEIQKPSLAVLDCQMTEMQHLFQNLTLVAMRLGSRKARLTFPFVLQTLSESHAEADFINKVNEIPSWMFIEWLPQLLAFVSTPVGLCAIQLILMVARDYPKALTYTWKVSVEDWKNLPSNITPYIQEISNLISGEDIDPFLEALSTLSAPEMLLRDLIEEMAVKGNKDSQAAYMERMTENLFSKNSFSDMRNAFAVKHKQSWTSLVGKISKVDLKKKVEELRKYLEKLKVDKSAQKKKGAMKLSDYSRWFTSYTPDSLELPGQYNGIDKPNPSHHKKIAAFEETVTVMDSLRKPVKINMLLNNGESTSVLVKGGEDLRTDQRVMQLLKVMDGKLRCTLRDASLRTYDVIPLTNNLGMIAWLPNTTTIKAVLFQDDASKKKAAEARQDYSAWIGRFKGYTKMYQRCSLDDVVLQNNKIAAQISNTLLKSVLVNLARSPNSFVLLRKKFVSTYLSMCLCHWILGVGDRHLNNYLLDTTTGELIGIDFGHVFGTATTLLPIPELLPFRVTPQFRGVFAPLGVDAAMRGPMTNALTALRDIRSVLFCLMDVFVREPTLDWCKYSKKHTTNIGNSKGGEDSWYPRAKVETARKKLELGNPSEILREELKENVHVGKEQAFWQVATGTRKLHARARVGAVCDTVDEQVHCLLELATDPNVLGRQFVGLEAWL